MFKQVVAKAAFFAAVVSMVTAPVVAQSNTRAGDFSTAYSAPLAEAAIEASTDDDGLLGGLDLSTVVIALFAGYFIASGIVIATKDERLVFFQSPGAN